LNVSRLNFFENKEGVLFGNLFDLSYFLMYCVVSHCCLLFSFAHGWYISSFLYPWLLVLSLSAHEFNPRCADNGLSSVFQKLDLITQCLNKKQNQTIAHMTYSEYNNLQVKNGVRYQSFVDGSGPSALESIESYKPLTTEAVLVANMTPVVEVAMQPNDTRGIGEIKLVNSEELRWIHTSSGDPTNFQKCDLILMNDGLQIEHVETGTPEARNERLKSTFSYKFGTVPWVIRDMIRVVIEFKVKICPQGFGELASYLTHLSIDDKFNKYYGILCDKSSFTLQTCKGGELSDACTIPWTAAGSGPMLTKFCSHRNYWMVLLDEICISMNVSLVTSAFLGAGGYGRVFKVEDIATKSIYALKIVLFIQNDKSEPTVVRQLVELEYDMLENINSSHVVNVKADSLKIIKWKENETQKEIELGAGYLMSNIGEPVLPGDCTKRNKLTTAGRLVLQSLCNLHVHDRVVHGDARINNVVWDSIANVYKWIDFMRSSSKTFELRMHQDLSLLLDTMLPVKLEAHDILHICSLGTLELKCDAIDALLASISSKIPSASL
jgi:hypothetical protein